MAMLQQGLMTLQKEITHFFLMLAAMDTPEAWGEGVSEGHSSPEETRH